MTPRMRAVVLIGALIVNACGSTTTSTPAFTDGAQASPIASSAPPALAGVTETPALTPESTPAPTAKPPATPAAVAATRWTKPRRIGTLATCSTIAAGIDVASRFHVAAECAGNIRHYLSTDGRAWKASVFAHPARRLDLDPHIAFWGNTVYVAYSRIALEDGGCGVDWNIRDVGVYYRWQTQPDGVWSPPVQIGGADERLDEFRVEGETVHALISNASTGRTYYATRKGSTVHRYRIAGDGPLRIGSDGRARMAFQDGTGLRYGVFDGSDFSRTRIAGTNERDQDAALVLDSGDKAHVVWTRVPLIESSGGCVIGEQPKPKDQGTYYANNVNGTWQSQRITRDIGETSLQVDQVTGRVHVLVNSKRLRYYTTAGDGKWTASTVTSASVSSPLLRLDPATGTLLIVYLGGPDSTKIYALTKP